MWEGYINNKHIFNITQKQQYFELSLVNKSFSSQSLDEANKKAELFLEAFSFK